MYHCCCALCCFLIIFFSVQILLGGGVAAAASTLKSDARLRQLLVGGEIFLGSALSASLTKMTLRAMDLLGDSSPAAKEMQARTYACACFQLVSFLFCCLKYAYAFNSCFSGFAVFC